jgi:DNA excision repair protein ERCC-2
MKYSEEKDIFETELSEFVRIAEKNFIKTPPTYLLTDSASEDKSGSQSKEYYSFSAFGENFILSYNRADMPTDGEVLFTHKGNFDLENIPRDLVRDFRSLGFINAYLSTLNSEKQAFKLTFVYINEENGEFVESTEEVTKRRLIMFFNKCLGSFSSSAKPEADRLKLRAPSMRHLKFPYPNIREGQREFVRSAYRNFARGSTLYATAPTGTGKTVSALYPAVKAMGEGLRDKTFYFTPKETTSLAAKDCIELMNEKGALVRGVILSAKEKCCPYSLICREDKKLCKVSENKDVHLAAAELYSRQIPVVTPKEIDTVANLFSVCPYELSLCYAECADVVICDYNYLFDRSVYIKRFFTDGGNYIFLFDEAHNLPDRAREIFSSSVSYEELISAVTLSPLGEFSAVRTTAFDASQKFYDILKPYLKENSRKNSEGIEISFSHLSEIPYELYDIFDKLIAVTDDELKKEFSARDEEKRLRIKFLYDYLHILRDFRETLEAFDSSYELFLTLSGDNITAKLFCADPAGEISKRLKLGGSSLFFSATLTPLYYYKSVLGGGRNSDTLEVSSPFDPSQLSVTVMDRISTRYSERERTLGEVIRVITAAISAKRGNYIVFSPSFAYSDALCEAFKRKYPNLRVVRQTKNMSREEKENFISSFTNDDKSYLVAFAVMGGIYSEGIDLAGESLIGAVIVGIGLPGLSNEREALSAYYEEKYEEGKQFAYIYPGMNRVLQAAGRVIRREDDRGIIVLIDDRFNDPIYKKTIPKLWSGMKFTDDAKDLKSALDEFWKTK